jgi:carbonic anhydrase
MSSQVDNSQTITKEIQQSISPATAVDILKAGNSRFTNKSPLNRNLNEQVSQTTGGQNPFAVVLSCIDSRVPVELVFDQGIGDIFSARVAGNIVNEDVLGSLEYSCKVAGSKTIVVLGHSQCGAVKSACDDVQLGNITALLSKIQPAVKAVNDVPGERNSSNPAFVQKVVDTNVVLTIEQIKKDSPILNEMAANGEISIVGAVYFVEDGRVEFFS